ncbi:tetratricopeptide repeat protein [Ideonella sp.]|uniref:tetratricopeptide repeat protein n=1 Tax=Ideonella sp. TaxID=1929293 RepID=UPI0035AEDB53
MDPLSASAVAGVAQCVAPALAGTTWDFIVEQSKSLPAGVLGNEIHRLLTSHVWPGLHARFTRVQLPQDHPLAQTSKLAMRNALVSFTQGLAASVEPSEGLFRSMRRFLRSGTRFEDPGTSWERNLRSEWIRELHRVVLSDEALEELEGQELGSVEAAKLLRQTEGSAAQDALAERVREWIACHMSGKAGQPPVLDTLLSEGWCLEQGDPIRVTLYDAWRRHFRYQLSQNPHALSDYVVTHLAELVPEPLKARLEDVGSIEQWLDEKVAAIARSLDRIEVEVKAAHDSIKHLGTQLEAASAKQLAQSARNEEMLQELLAVARRHGRIGAGVGQVGPRLAIQLARLINEDLPDDFDLATQEMTYTVDRAAGLVDKGRDRSGGSDRAADEALKRLANLAGEGDLDAAADLANRYVEELQRREEAQRAGRRRILEARVTIEILRRRADGAVDAILKLALLDGGSSEAVDEILEKRTWDFEEDGDLQGSDIALQIAIVLARYRLGRSQHPRARAGALFDLGNALMKLGSRESDIARLEEAVQTLRSSLRIGAGHLNQTKRAAIKNSLGLALRTLGERESTTDKLEESAVILREALLMWEAERIPEERSITQQNLGISLLRIGERESSIDKLEEAIAAFRSALLSQTRERAAIDWAATQNNLGIALLRLGENGQGTADIQESVIAFREALQGWRRDRVPLRWAMAQSNLGNALLSLGERESGTSLLREAVASHRKALEERTRVRTPFHWAETQNNLGCSLKSLGEREGGTAQLEEAVAAFQQVLEEWTQDRVPLYWQGVHDELQCVVKLIAERQSGATPRLDSSEEDGSGIRTQLKFGPGSELEQ